MKVYDMCAGYLCESVRRQINSLDLDGAEEIRLRLGKPLRVRYGDREEKLSYIVSAEDIESIYGRMTQYSPYAFKDELNAGYITLAGGFRVGITGTVASEMGRIKNIKDISGMNIRIAREIKGCSEKIIDYVKGNTLIVSPPGAGKTTLLRDIIRLWSNRGRNICVVDERNEISSTFMGISQMDLGERTDVIVNAGKTEGFEMALRAMAPDVIAADEIGGERDVYSIKRALNCGVEIIATLHSGDEEDMLRKADISALVREGVFDTYIFMHRHAENRIRKICNRELVCIWQGR